MVLFGKAGLRLAIAVLVVLVDDTVPALFDFACA